MATLPHRTHQRTHVDWKTWDFVISKLFFPIYASFDGEVFV